MPDGETRGYWRGYQDGKASFKVEEWDRQHNIKSN